VGGGRGGGRGGDRESVGGGRAVGSEDGWLMVMEQGRRAACSVPLLVGSLPRGRHSRRSNILRNDRDFRTHVLLSPDPARTAFVAPPVSRSVSEKRPAEDNACSTCERAMASLRITSGCTAYGLVEWSEAVPSPPPARPRPSLPHPPTQVHPPLPHSPALQRPPLPGPPPRPAPLPPRPHAPASTPPALKASPAQGAAHGTVLEHPRVGEATAAWPTVQARRCQPSQRPPPSRKVCTAAAKGSTSCNRPAQPTFSASVATSTLNMAPSAEGPHRRR
jgi:hypothetical protein